jgi:hypothetical protein
MFRNKLVLYGKDLKPGNLTPQGGANSRRLSATAYSIYEGVSKSFRTGRLERELQMVQLSAIKCSCIAILWVV